MSIRPKTTKQPENVISPSAAFAAVSSHMATANMAHLPTAIPVAVSNGYTPSPAVQQSCEVAKQAASMGMAAPVLEFDQLNPTEQAAASLGVQPDALKPIGWLNDAHHKSLLDNNMLDSHLARRIEAYKVVSTASAEAAGNIAA